MILCQINQVLCLQRDAYALYVFFFRMKTSRNLSLQLPAHIAMHYRVIIISSKYDFCTRALNSSSLIRLCLTDFNLLMFSSAVIMLIIEV